MRHTAVCLNGRFSGTLQPTGTQTSAFHTFDAILKAERNFAIVVFADLRFPGVNDWRDIPKTKVVPVPFSTWSRPRAQLWEQLVLPRAARRHGCALIHHPLNTSSRLRLGMKHLVTVHDLNFVRHPEWFSLSFRTWMMLTALPGMRSASYVATVSDHVLREVRTTGRISPAKSARIYNGCKQLPATVEVGNESNTILALNVWQPHKNLARLIAAFRLLRVDFPTLRLRIAGRLQAQFRSGPSLAAMLQEPGISVLGYLSEIELAQAYKSAHVFCYPSLEEGFGLPILEALSAGTRVVTSNSSCLPEIAGGAAILIDPASVPSIAAGLREALRETPAERAKWITKGKSVAASFSWQQAAQSYLSIYRKLLATS
ncbi:MAG: glycosyltransferase family 4 protein [Chthoniobacterales bacterium]|nr:glycosyltransferase family 4 protein [Chthoniobacterales bacterium]